MRKYVYVYKTIKSGCLKANFINGTYKGLYIDFALRKLSSDVSVHFELRSVYLNQTYLSCLIMLRLRDCS